VVDTEYTEKLAQGRLLAMTPWVKFEEEFQASNHKLDCSSGTVSPYYRYWIKDTPELWLWWNHTPKPPWCKDRTYFDNLVPNQDYGYYVQAAAARIYSSGWDALTFGAELSKTVAMFRGMLSRWMALVVRSLKGDPSGFARLWLEARYGWRTLFYDMQDIDKAIKNLNEGRKRFRETAGKWADPVVETTTYTNTAAWGTLTASVTSTMKIGTRGTVVADINPPQLMFNPLTTSWELMTFSFVIDWVINVGQFLESLSFLALQREYVAAGGVSITYDAVQTSSYSPSSGFGGTWKLNSHYSASYVKRIPHSVSPIPMTKLRLDEYKVLDVVSIFVTWLVKAETVRLATRR